MPVWKRSSFLILLVCSPLTLVYGQNGWQAADEVIAEAEENNPGFVFTEEEVAEYKLPELLLEPNGSVVEDKAAWDLRRVELLNLFREQVYGRTPGKPDNMRFEVIEEDPSAMGGAATLRRIAITSEYMSESSVLLQDLNERADLTSESVATVREEARRSHTFELVLFIPNNREGAVPVFLLMNNREAENMDPTRAMQSDFWPAEALIARGYAIAGFQVAAVAPDDPDYYRTGAISLLEKLPRGSADAWATLAAWAWGASRVMDYFETDELIDATRVAVVGHSRGGKAALWAGAEDERFGLVISNDSGAGGAALGKRVFGETVEALNTNFPHWFTGNFKQYSGNEAELPVDQHALVALIAPRPIYIGSADEDLWADPRGEFLSLAYGSKVYELLGHEAISTSEMPPLDQPLTRGPLGYHIRSGEHNLTLWDWERYMDFADRLW